MRVFVKLFGSDVSSKKGCSLISREKTTDRRERFDARVSRDDDDDEKRFLPNCKRRLLLLVNAFDVALIRVVQ